MKFLEFARATLAFSFSIFSLNAGAVETINLQLKWLPQAQFAGYYVAQAKGYYKAEGLNVVIKPGGPNIAPAKALVSNQADVMVNWMSDALAAREAGIPLVNIAQVFNRSGLMLTCKKASGVSTAKDLKGKTLGVWFGGNEYPFLNWMSKLGYKTDADLKPLKPGFSVDTRTRLIVPDSEIDIRILRQGFTVEPLLSNQAACISTMVYNEYWQLIDAGVKESDLVTFFYEEQGVSSLEDGLYALESTLANPAFAARMSKFVKASMKGWLAAVKDPDEAARIVVAASPPGSTTFEAQRRQMENVSKLVTSAPGKLGFLEPTAFERTVKVLLTSSGAPVIRRDPGSSAFTHSVWHAAQK